MSIRDLLVGLRHADFGETLAEVEGQADLILTSPPYEDARTYGDLDASWTLEDYQRLGDSVARALRPDGGQCLMVLGGPVRDYRGDGWTERSVMPYRVLLDWRDRLGLVTPDVYVYGRDGQAGSFKGRNRCNWEPLMWFAKAGERTFHRKTAAALRPGRSWGRRRGRRASGRTEKNAGYSSTGAQKDAGNVWVYGNIGPNCGGPTEHVDHPARFPYRLAADIVACFSNPGDLVVDPFVGSGTALVAALDGGRRFFGGDLGRDKHGTPWVEVADEIARERYRQMTINDLTKEG
jgi:DNA modification methylase